MIFLRLDADFGVGENGSCSFDLFNTLISLFLGESRIFVLDVIVSSETLIS